MDLDLEISTIILKVDLDCHQCYKKIRKILCKLQDQERIRTISYDNKSNTIAIAGPFDAHKLSCRIRCQGGKVIKDVHIIDGGGGGKPAKMADHAPPQPVSKGNKQKHCKDKHKDQMPPPAAAEPPPPPAEKLPPPSPPPAMAQLAPPDREMSAVMPAAIVEEKEKKERPMRERPLPAVAVKPFYPVDVTPTLEIPSWPAMPPVGPCGCACGAPCYQGYYEGCRCGSCGRVYGSSVAAPPPSAGCYGGCAGAGAPYCGGYSGCRIVNEEDPTAACSIM